MQAIEERSDRKVGYSSVIRLGDFLKLRWKNFLTKVPKTLDKELWLLFEQLMEKLATFYSNVWSHCRPAGVDGIQTKFWTRILLNIFVLECENRTTRGNSNLSNFWVQLMEKIGYFLFQRLVTLPPGRCWRYPDQILNENIVKYFCTRVWEQDDTRKF